MMAARVALLGAIVAAGYFFGACGGYECRCPAPKPLPAGTFQLAKPGSAAAAAAHQMTGQITVTGSSVDVRYQRNEQAPWFRARYRIRTR